MKQRSAASNDGREVDNAQSGRKQVWQEKDFKFGNSMSAVIAVAAMQGAAVSEHNHARVME